MHWFWTGGCAQVGFALSTKTTAAASTNFLAMGFRVMSLLPTFVGGAAGRGAAVSAHV
jgi:hypothetical protein